MDIQVKKRQNIYEESYMYKISINHRKRSVSHDHICIWLCDCSKLESFRFFIFLWSTEHVVLLWNGPFLTRKLWDSRTTSSISFRFVFQMSSCDTDLFRWLFEQSTITYRKVPTVILTQGCAVEWWGTKRTEFESWKIVKKSWNQCGC